MAWLKKNRDLVIRAAEHGEGRVIAGLWRQLWETHERWGGYPSARESRVYEQLSVRLDEDARVRAGQPVLGRHVHLVAARDGLVIGQVEGWFERHGTSESTPHTCEVRSLIVRETARSTGAGRALLEALARTAASMGRGEPVVLAAEVLEPNPAHAFYDKVGYHPVAWSTRIDVGRSMFPPTPYWGRVAEPRDALPLALLDSILATRRRSLGDVRFDRPRAVDATLVGAIAGHLAQVSSAQLEPLEIVVLDAGGVIRGSATFCVTQLDPPFVPARRALLARVAIDPGYDVAAAVSALVQLACGLAVARGAATVEITDLPGPGSPLHAAMLAAGAAQWSRIVLRESSTK
jgi:GNAT superfamily N-acetyltransferase